MQSFLLAVLAELLKFQPLAVVCGSAFLVAARLVVQMFANGTLKVYETFLGHVLMTFDT